MGSYRCSGQTATDLILNLPVPNEQQTVFCNIANILYTLLLYFVIIEIEIYFENGQ